METVLKVDGMSCAMCVGHVTRALQGVSGVQSAQVDLGAGRASVQHDGADVKQMIEAIEEEGYEAQAASQGAQAS